MPTTQELIARRIGRITFGAVLLAGVAYLAVSASALVFQDRWPQEVSRFDPAQILSATWLIALIAGAIARAIARRVPTGCGPAALFTESVITPVLGIALILPLTLHMPIALLISDREGFRQWVGMSLWVTGVSHVVFALTATLRGYQLTVGRRAWSPGRILALTVLTSCVPFIVLMAIPPVLVAVTMLPILPMLHAMERIVANERAEIAAAPQALPRAIAVPPRSMA